MSYISCISGSQPGAAFPWRDLRAHKLSPLAVELPRAPQLLP